MKRAKKLLVVGLATIGLFVPLSSIAEKPVKPSAFIEGPVQLEKNPKRVGSYRYINPEANLGRYTTVSIAPIEFFIDWHSDYKGMNPNDFKFISDMFRRTLIDVLEPDYPVVDKVGADTIHIRLALTGIKLKKKRRGLIAITPVGLASGAFQDVSKKVILLDAVIEAELLDAATGERVAVLVDQNINYDGSGAESWEAMQRNLRYYAQRLKERLKSDKQKM
jgi:hypothetical protein